MLKMTSRSRRFIPAALIAALLLQLLPVALPHQTFASLAAESQLQQLQAANEAAVKITGIFVRDPLPGGAVPRDISLPDQLPGGNGILRRVEVTWNVALPKGVTLEGFDVEIKATLTKGGPLFERRAFGANARRADINLQLPGGNAAPNNPSAGNAGTGNTGAGNTGGGSFGGGPFDCAKCATPNKLTLTEQRVCNTQCKNSASNAADCKGVDCRICQGQPSSSLCQTCCNPVGGGQNVSNKETKRETVTTVSELDKCLTACNSKTGLAKQKCQDDCRKKHSPPPRSGKFNFLPQSFVPGNFLINHLAPQIQKSQGEPRGLIVLPDNPNELPAQISAVTATVTARLGRPAQAIALREFLPPAAAVIGELAPNPNPNRTREIGGLRLLKLIEIAKVPALARECPANQDCFDVIAEARGTSAVNIKVSLEVLYSSNQRKEAPPRLVNSLARPVRISVERPRDATFVTVTPTVLAETSEAFTRSDTDQKFFPVIGK